MVYKKKIDNSSQWKLDGLVKIINRCEEFRGVDLNQRLKPKTRRTRNGVNHWSPLRIGTCKSSRGGSYTGRCYGGHLHGSESSCSTRNKGNIYLGIPKARKYVDTRTSKWSRDPEPREFDKERFSAVILHEIDHLLGLKHKDMMDSSELETPDVSDIEVERKEEHKSG